MEAISGSTHSTERASYACFIKYSCRWVQVVVVVFWKNLYLKDGDGSVHVGFPSVVVVVVGRGFLFSGDCGSFKEGRLKEYVVTCRDKNCDG